MIPFIAVLATERDGVAALPVSCVAALRLVGTVPADRHDAGPFACATSAAEGEANTIRVDAAAIVVGDVRLDGRDGLRLALGVRAGELDDLGLVLAAYRRWGTTFVDRLRGDFSLAVWDRRERTLIAARDGLGVRALYYARAPGGLIVSNVLDALRAYPGVTARLDTAAVASFLRFGWNADTTTTSFVDIRRLAPGVMLSAKASAHDPELRTHWRMPNPEAVELGSDDAYQERYRTVLAEAVRDRVDARGTMLFLSGGIDSTTIAATARSAMPDARLSAFTWRTLGSEDATESRLASTVASRWSIPHRIVEVPPRVHLGPRRSPEPMDEPELEWTAQFVGEAARSSGARIAIEGEDGDALFAPPGLGTMLRRERASRVVARLIQFVVRHRRKPYLGWWIARKLGLTPRPFNVPVPSWLTPVASASIASIAGSIPRGVSVAARPEASRSLTAPIWQRVHEGFDRATTGVPLDYRWPLLDSRLIEFVFSIPAIPWCQAKELPRRTFQGMLPPEVLTRPKALVPAASAGLLAQWDRSQVGAPLHDVTREFVSEPQLRAALGSGDDATTLQGWRALQFDGWVREAGL